MDLIQSEFSPKTKTQFTESALSNVFFLGGVHLLWGVKTQMITPKLTSRIENTTERILKSIKHRKPSSCSLWNKFRPIWINMSCVSIKNQRRRETSVCVCVCGAKSKCLWNLWWSCCQMNMHACSYIHTYITLYYILYIYIYI